MVLAGISLLLITLILLYCSSCARARIIVRKTHNLPTEPRHGPFSQALTEMVSTAGGIYVALLLLTSFLAVSLPEQILFLGVGLDPLAVVALVITLVQPFFAGGLK